VIFYEDMSRKRKWLLASVLVIAGVIVLGEFILRYVYGFAKAPLYYESDVYEYMFCPSQSGKRFGNKYYFNSYGMRSEEVDSSKVIVLGLGDSVLFGGVLIDQDSTAAYVFSRLTGMQMLGICVGSWGPDNCAAYLRQYGMFGAKAICLLVSSHDAYDNMDFIPVVGKHVSYPMKQYKSAWGDLIVRYVLPRISAGMSKPKKLDPDATVVKNEGITKNGVVFNPGFAELKQMADSIQIPLVVFLHPDIHELKQGAYNKQGCEIIQWCEQNHVLCIKELENGISEACYRDVIHTNSMGAQYEGELMAEYISELLLAKNDR